VGDIVVSVGVSDLTGDQADEQSRYQAAFLPIHSITSY
jgi:hypothetical protein